jgi:LPXTG-motif cell wall-anchored protein
VEAPVGAFPAGTTMTVTPVAQEDIMDAVQSVVEENIKTVSAVDITFTDLMGDEIEPYGEIKVSMSSTEIVETEEPVVVHVDDEGTAAVVESQKEEEQVVFAADSFSVYVIVGTETITANYITAEGDTYTITVSYDKDAEIPEGATLEVNEIINGDKDYTGYVEQAAKALSEGEEVPFVNAARLFDISIMADGKKVEPKAPVEVKIEYANAENLNETSEVGAVHFKESFLKTETEVMDVNVQSEAGKLDSVTFTTDSFSIYAVVIIDKEAGTFVFEDDNYKITVSYTKEANIPIGTEMAVKEITAEDDQYWTLLTDTADALNEGVEWENEDFPDPRKGVASAVFFDVSLIFDGKEIEPAVPLQVKIDFKQNGIVVPDGENTKAVHFGDKGTEFIEDVDVELSDTDDETLATSFTYMQDGFSPLGVISTGEYIDVKTIESGAMRALAAPLRAASEISASKTVTDTDGDGVYELALNVTGSSESSSSTKVDKANVVLVIDTSGSMGNNYTYTPYTYSSSTYNPNTEYYGVYNGNYYRVRRNNNNTGWRYNDYNYAYTGTVYTRQTRMEATKDAAVALVDALLANNKNQITEDGVNLNDIIEISLVTFAGARNNNTNGYLRTYDNAHFSGTADSASATTLKNHITNLTAVGGTNWEQALKAANTSAGTYSNQAGETTSIIFLTDGKPTFYGSNDNGDGQEGDTNVRTSWNNASDDARAIISPGGYTLYNIFAFGTDTGTNSGSNYLKALTNYAYTGTGTYSNYETTQYTRDYFFDASDTKALTDAFQKIIDNISNTVGYGGVDFEDGVTVGVTNTSVTVDGTVHDESFRYTVRNGNNIVYTVHIADGTATFSIDGQTYTDTSAEEVVTKIDPDNESTWIRSTVYSVTVGEGDSAKTYMMSPATINKDTGLVDWDLAGLGILENGYTYTVAFDVWPNQYAYDLVADLNNGVKTLDQIKAELIGEYGEEEGTYLYNQIVAALQGPDENGQYSILTNWEQKVNYYTVDTVEDDEGSTTTYTQQPTKELPNPSPVALTSKPLPMVKVWNSNLSPDQIGNLLYKDYPTNSIPTEYKVTLHLWKANTQAELDTLIEQYSRDQASASEYDYLEKTLGWNGTEYDWDDTAAIAPGTMVSLQTAIDMGIDTTSAEHQKNIVSYDGAQYYIIETGHYYYVTEDNIDWHFELETVLYHPMMVNGRLKNVTFITDDEGNITGVEDIVDMTEVSAANSKTAELDITKKIVDNTGNMTQSQMDAETFTYKISLTVPIDADMSHTNALEWVARYDDDPSASNRYYVFGYQTSEEPEVLGLDDDVERFNGKVYGQYTVSYPGGSATLDEIFTEDPGGTTKSGTIYVTLLKNEIIRFTNLPSGTQYRIEEMYNNLYQANPSRDADANLGDNAPASNVEENGYTVTIATKNGEPTASGRVVSGTIDELNRRYYNQFTNTLDDTAVVDLDVTKHLQGYEWTGERYYVKLAAADENAPLPRITTRYLSAASGSDDVTFNFGSVHLEPGTYTYTITETDSNYAEAYSGKVVNGITYDSVKTIIVTVADDLSVSIAEGSSDGVTYDSDTNTVKTKVTNKVMPLSIYKFGGSGLSEIENKLSGVQFKLYSDSDLTQQVKQDARGNAIGTDGLITTGEDGTANLGVLNTGKYYLVETDLGNNSGYNKLTDAVEIEVGNTIHYKQIGWSPSVLYNSASSASDLVKANGGMYINYADDGTTISGYTFTINNNTGVQLPMTGGSGTLPYTLGGIALIMAAALMYGFRLRRRERRLR